MNLALLHVCDSLFPLGGFAYSDGLEAATSELKPATSQDSVEHLRAWLETLLEDSIGRLEGPVAWSAWRAFQDEDFALLVRLDEEAIALRPSSTARRSSRAMGQRLLATWNALHPDPRLTHLTNLSAFAPAALPVAFGAVCASSGIPRRESVEAFAYTRLAASVSAAMRLMPIGQTDAHRLLARALDAVPAVVESLAARDGEPESFTPMMDIAAMTQQYLHSRLFRS